MLFAFNVFQSVLTWGLYFLAGLVAWKLLVGGIFSDGLLSATPDGPADVGRVQMLLVAVFGAADYLAQCVETIGSEEAISVMPEAPEWLLVIFAGSQALYLLEKVTSNGGLTISVGPNKRRRGDGRGDD